MTIEYDAEANALYLRFRPGKVAETIELEELVHLDVDRDGRPLGLEFVDADDFLPFLRRHAGRIEIPERIADTENVALAG